MSKSTVKRIVRRFRAEKRAPLPRPNRKRSGRFPKNKLEDVVRLIQVIEEKNAGKPIRSEDLAKLLGFSGTSDWRFLDLLNSANQRRVVTGSGRKATVTLTQIGSDIVAPSSPQQRQKARLTKWNNLKA